MFVSSGRMLLQRSLDDLGAPLWDVTFCVVDLETTGGSPATASITEIGAVKVRGGRVEGTFQTLVDPGAPVPAFIRLLTGISDEMLAGAPPIEAVLPSFLEFCRGAVLVAHNARFDVGFLNAALVQASYSPLANPVIDTARLAQKILAGEVRNRRLDTLAHHFRCPHQPCHRAYPDALATVDVLHHLIERVAGFGVTTLEDLVGITSARIDRTFSKIRLAEDLPRGLGVYRFVGAGGNTLYVGKTSDVRARVRSYFYSDTRAKIRDLLRETEAITAESYATSLEAEIAEARAIARELPPYNRVGKRTGCWYVKVRAAKTSKVALSRVPKEDGATYLGPFLSAAAARSLIEALRDAVKIHRCSTPESCAGCAFSQMGRCRGVDRAAHRREVEVVLEALAGNFGLLLQPLFERMMRLARAGRFEEAAEARERGARLERALRTSAAARAVVQAGEIVLAAGARVLLISGGRLRAAVDAGGGEDAALARSCAAPATAPEVSFLTPEVQREALIVASWLDRHAREAAVLACSGTWALPLGARPVEAFKPRS